MELPPDLRIMIEGMQRELAQLRVENIRLREDNAQLKQEVSDLKKEVAHLKRVERPTGY
jgi:predicted nuclease with TOPRIM domain